MVVEDGFVPPDQYFYRIVRKCIVSTLFASSMNCAYKYGEFDIIYDTFPWMTLFRCCTNNHVGTYLCSFTTLFWVAPSDIA